MAGVIRSADNGETWGDISLMFTKTEGLPYEETAPVLVAPDDRLLAHMRAEQHNIVQFVSEDKGRTWTGPTQVTEPGQQPGGPFPLASGRVMATWGNRRGPHFGACAMLSEDGGKTWDYDRRGFTRLGPPQRQLRLRQRSASRRRIDRGHPLLDGPRRERPCRPLDREQGLYGSLHRRAVSRSGGEVVNGTLDKASSR